MDVAEQALTALAMLSRRHGKAILQAVSQVINTVIITSTCSWDLVVFRKKKANKQLAKHFAFPLFLCKCMNTIILVNRLLKTIGDDCIVMLTTYCCHRALCKPVWNWRKVKSCKLLSFKVYWYTVKWTLSSFCYSWTRERTS